MSEETPVKLSKSARRRARKRTEKGGSPSRSLPPASQPWLGRSASTPSPGLRHATPSGGGMSSIREMFPDLDLGVLREIHATFNYDSDATLSYLLREMNPQTAVARPVNPPGDDLLNRMPLDAFLHTTEFLDMLCLDTLGRVSRGMETLLRQEVYGQVCFARLYLPSSLHHSSHHAPRPRCFHLPCAVQVPVVPAVSPLVFAPHPPHAGPLPQPGLALLAQVSGALFHVHVGQNALGVSPHACRIHSPCAGAPTSSCFCTWAPVWPPSPRSTSTAARCWK